MNSRLIKLKDLKRKRGHCGIVKKLLKSKKISIDHVIIDKAVRHYHKNSAEYYFIIDGNGKMELNKKIFRINRGDLVCIPPQIWHKAIPNKYLSVLVIAIPPMKLEDSYFS